jgi:hypothetical protein
MFEKYFPPITVYKQMTTNIQQDIDKKIEEGIYEAVLNLGVDVDKAELLKALKYDRDQYAKGYLAGRQSYLNDTDRLHEDEVLALKINTFNKIYDSFFQDMDLSVFLHNVSIYMNSYNQELAKIKGIDISD